MIAERESGSGSRGNDASEANRTFGELSKRSGRTVSRASAAKAVQDNVKSLGGGGMEYSFIPSTTADEEEREEKKAARKAKLAKETTKKSEFGVGLQKGSTIERRDEGEDLTGEDREGRKRRRQIGRSASNSAIRRQSGGNQAMKRRT